jgi:aminoglycoside 3-N-acetyltransferase
MRILLRKLLARTLDEKTKKALKRAEFKIKKRLARMGSPLQRDDLTRIFTTQLGLQAGDVVMVHASASMLHTPLTPQDILTTLRDVITPSGTIVAPTFPAMSSMAFMSSAVAFDARTTSSGMGAFSEALRNAPGARRSIHPTKSIAAIGPLAAELCTGHERCLYPFGRGSPYEKLLAQNVKIIGIGVPMSYLSFVHVAEDLFVEKMTQPIWAPDACEKTCIDMEGQAHLVRSMVHNMALMPKANPEKFCRLHLQKKHYVTTHRHWAEFFVVDGQALTNSILDALQRGVTIYD